MCVCVCVCHTHFPIISCVGFSYVYLVKDRQGRLLALVRMLCLLFFGTPFSHSCLLPSQKQQLLQVPEQRKSLDNEVATHRAVQHSNVLELVDHEIVERGGRGGGGGGGGGGVEEHDGPESNAYLIFPFYPVYTHTHWLPW